VKKDEFCGKSLFLESRKKLIWPENPFMEYFGPQKVWKGDNFDDKGPEIHRAILSYNLSKFQILFFKTSKSTETSICVDNNAL